jgi:hypothetical protein
MDLESHEKKGLKALESRGLAHALLPRGAAARFVSSA